MWKLMLKASNRSIHRLQIIEDTEDIDILAKEECLKINIEEPTNFGVNGYEQPQVLKDVGDASVTLTEQLKGNQGYNALMLLQIADSNSASIS